MKRVIAYISLIFYVGYASGILLKTYNQAGSSSSSDESNTAYCLLIYSAELSDTSSHSKFSTPEFIAPDALTASTGKLKLPDASSCPVIAATFTISPYQVVYNATVADPAQLHTQPTPIFLQNCVLRL